MRVRRRICSVTTGPCDRCWGCDRPRAWPPSGRDHTPGPWDRDHGGIWAFPCLTRLRDEPEWGGMPASFGMGEASDAHRTWLAVRLLGLAGYIDVHVERTSATSAALTLDGRRALDGPPDAFTVVRTLLVQSDITRALIDLVEGIVANLVAKLADLRAIPLVDRDGKPLVKIRQRVGRLEKHGALTGVDAGIRVSHWRHETTSDTRLPTRSPTGLSSSPGSSRVSRPSRPGARSGHDAWPTRLGSRRLRR